MTKWLLIGFGGICTVTGLITFWLPIPTGLPLLLIGTPILLRNSARSRKLLVRLMRRYPGWFKKLRRPT